LLATVGTVFADWDTLVDNSRGRVDGPFAELSTETIGLLNISFAILASISSFGAGHPISYITHKKQAGMFVSNEMFNLSTC
jgi:hypothetical protein